MDACSERRLGAREFLRSFDQMLLELLEIVRSTVRQLPFQMSPDSFVGVEIRGVCGKAIQRKSRVATADFANRVSAVLAKIVPKDDHVAPEMAEEMTKEHADFGLLDVLPMELVVETDPSPLRTHGDSGDRRNAIVTMVMVMNGCLATRGPGLSDWRDQKEAGFVDEDDVGAQTRSPLFIRGHSRRFHSSILSSSR